jgi:hypothetical protein
VLDRISNPNAVRSNQTQPWADRSKYKKQVMKRTSVMISLALIIWTGCNSNWSTPTGTAKVQGKVTLDGSPIHQAKIIFVPNTLRNPAGKLMPLAFGLTDEEGKFEMKYSDGVDQLMSGTYTVVISKKNENTNRRQNTALAWETENYILPDDVAKFESFQNSEDVFPAVYNSDSILVFEVTKSAEANEAKFELSTVDPALQEQQKSSN